MRSTYIRNGIFTLLFLLAAGYLFTNIDVLPNPWERQGKTMKVRLDDVAGLETGGAVRIAGVRMGQIQEISLEDQEAVVTIVLNPGVELRQGANAKIGSMGLMGEKYLDLTPGDSTQPTLDAQSVIVGESPTTIDELVTTFNAVGEDVKEVTESLANTLGSDQGEQSIDEIVKNIEAITAELKTILQSNSGNVDATMDNVRIITEDIKEIVKINKEVVNRTIANAEGISADLRRDIPELTGKLDSILDRMDKILARNEDDVDETIDNIASASGKIDETMDSVKSIASKIDEGEGTIGKLVNDEETVDNLNGAITEIRSAVASVGDALGVVNRLKTEIGYRGEFQFEEGEVKSFVTFRISPRQDKYYQVDLVGDPQKTREYQTITTNIDSSVTGQEVRVEERLKETDEFKFSAQFAKRFKNLTLRGGLIESSAGFGAEYHLIDGRLQFEVEAFDFGDDFEDPHLRFSSEFYVTPTLYLKAGVDNPLNEDVNTMFFGAGFRYSDEDLKYLFGSFGSFLSF